MMRAEGEWTQASASTVLASSQAWIDAGVLDLSGISHVDSTAVSLLLELTRRAKAAGKPLRFEQPPARLATLAHFFGVSQMLNLPETTA